MNTKSEWLALMSASYFSSWFVLLVVYHLSGWAQVSGGIISLWGFSSLLSSWRFSLQHTL